MHKASIYNIARARLNKDAVKFDQNIAWNEEDAWPYWYPLIPANFEETDGFNGGLGIIGFEIEPGEVKDVSITTDRDSPFRYINTKFVLNQCTVDCTVLGNSTLTVIAGNIELVAAAASFLASDIGRKVCWNNDNGIQETGIIAAFTDTTHVDLNVAPLANAGAGTVFNFSSEGIILSINEAGAVLGNGVTQFTVDYAEGQRFSWVDDTGLERCNMVGSISDNQNMQLADAVPANQIVVAGSNAHSPTRWVWYTAIGGASPQPQIPLTFKDIYTPLTRFMEVKLTIPSLKSINFYGNSLYQSDTGLTERRLPITVLQGEMDGNPMLKSPDALVPAEGTITYQLANIHTQPIFVNLVAFGYKISLENDVGE